MPEFGGIGKPEDIGTVVFQITDSNDNVRNIKLTTVLYIPDAPKSLISVSQWFKEMNDNC
eukprot:13660514-Ditylum_brightwellii.AAC.1